MIMLGVILLGHLLRLLLLWSLWLSSDFKNAARYDQEYSSEISAVSFKVRKKYGLKALDLWLICRYQMTRRRENG